MELTTARLILRPWSLDDTEEAFAIYRDPEVNRYIGGRTPPDVDHMRETLGHWIARSARYPAGMGVWAAVYDGTVVGCGLLKPPPASGHPAPADPTQRVLSEDVEVGWHLGRRWWGLGLATEMGRGMLNHGFRALGLDTIHAVVETPNEASQRVALRCGLQHVGRTRAYYDLHLEHFEAHRDAWLRAHS